MSLLLNHTRVSDEEYSAWDEWNTDDALREAVEKFKSPRKFPRTQSAAGIMKGISFLLLHDVIQNFSCPATSSSGFLVSIFKGSPTTSESIYLFHNPLHKGCCTLAL